MVQRVYVENREGGHAAALSAEYRVAVRMLNRYDVEGTTDAEFATAGHAGLERVVTEHDLE